jgi:hypothetical protein
VKGTEIKNMPRGNPSPVQTKEFKAHKFIPLSDLPDEPLSSKPLAIKVGESIHNMVVSLPQRDRINWLRRVITEAAQRELMKDGEV